MTILSRLSQIMNTCADTEVPQQPSPLQILDEWEWLIAPILFTALAFFTRLYKIGISNIVTWDEAQCVISLIDTCMNLDVADRWLCALASESLALTT